MHSDATTVDFPVGVRIGVNLAGYFDSVLGVGQVARATRQALERQDVPLALLPLVSAAGTKDRGAGPAGGHFPRYPLNLVCVNADGMRGAHDQLGAEAFAGRRTVGFWWWEAGAFPDRWRRSFDYVDEVWVGSRYVADALAPVAPVPVVRMPVPVPEPQPAPMGRTDFGLAEDEFVFLFVFDHESVFERKNPLAVVEAFARAFPDGSGVHLVVKCLNADRRPDEHAGLLDRARRARAVRVIERFMPSAEKDALVAACDCYISLHRAEGFGLTLAEATALGRPVIATGYSGPLDFLGPRTGYLVDYELVPIGPGNDPYPQDGWWAEPSVEHAAALMRQVFENREEAAARAACARVELERAHSLDAAGSAMVARLCRLAGMSPRATTHGDGALDFTAVERRIRMELEGERPGIGALRALVRRAVLRATKPVRVQQRMVDEDIVAALRTLDERVQGLAAAQATLAEQVAELRRGLDGG